MIINCFSGAVHQGVSYLSGISISQFGISFRGAIKQRVPARKFGCQRLQPREKRGKNEEVAKRRDKRRLRADSPRHKESPAAHKVTLDFISQMPNDVHPSSIF